MMITHERNCRSVRERIECADKKIVVIGTSGSTDYLHDPPGQYRPTRHDRRFWHVSQGEASQGESEPDDGQICDGLHDESAPVQYLCSRCFSDLRGDLAEIQEDEYDDDRRDDDEEMQ
jgi:hypothetical protein